MDARTTRLVASAIDSAIQTVGDAEYQRLSQGLSLYERKSKIQFALNSLDLLRSGNQPDYSNEWVALFYVLWYQPKQINLAYGLINEMLNRRNGNAFTLNRNGVLRIIDFGCGALATQFAVALFAAEAIDTGPSFQEIMIDSFDINQPMIDIGRRVWEQFKSETAAIPLSVKPLHSSNPTTLQDLLHSSLRG